MGEESNLELNVFLGGSITNTLLNQPNFLALAGAASGACAVAIPCVSLAGAIAPPMAVALAATLGASAAIPCASPAGAAATGIAAGSSYLRGAFPPVDFLIVAVASPTIIRRVVIGFASSSAAYAAHAAKLGG